MGRRIDFRLTCEVDGPEPDSRTLDELKDAITAGLLQIYSDVDPRDPDAVRDGIWLTEDGPRIIAIAVSQIGLDDVDTSAGNGPSA